MMLGCICRAHQRISSSTLPAQQQTSMLTPHHDGYTVHGVVQYSSKYIHTALSPVNSTSAAPAAPEAAPAAPAPLSPLPEAAVWLLLPLPLPLPLPASVRLARRSVLQRGQQGSRARSNHSSMHCCKCSVKSRMERGRFERGLSSMVSDGRKATKKEGAFVCRVR